MFNKKHTALIFILILGATSFAFAKSHKSVNVYTLIEMKQTVSNKPECEKVFKSLEEFGKKSFTMKFSKTGEGTFSVEDNSGRLKNHTHTIVKQEHHENSVHRVSMGSFELEGEMIDYTMHVTGNLDQKDHQYLYPVTFSSHHGHCYFNGIVKPSEETVADFKKDMASGAVKSGTDLHDTKK